MKLQFAKTLLLMALLPMVLTRCRQGSNPDTDFIIGIQEPINITTEEIPMAVIAVNFTVSARRLTGRNRDKKMVRIDPFPKVRIPGNYPEIDEESCFIRETQNPNFNQNFRVYYYENPDLSIQIEIRDNVEGGDDFSLGVTYVQVRSMLCLGRKIESPLWMHDSAGDNYVTEFNSGIAIVTTTSINPSSSNNCD